MIARDASKLNSLVSHAIADTTVRLLRDVCECSNGALLSYLKIRLVTLRPILTAYDPPSYHEIVQAFRECGERCIANVAAQRAEKGYKYRHAAFADARRVERIRKVVNSL